MIELNGDYWEYYKENEKEWSAIVFTSNCVLNNKKELIMGAGIAKDFKNIFPYLPAFYGRSIQKNFTNYIDKPHCLVATCDDIHKPLLIAFPTKYYWSNPSDIGLIVRSAIQLKYIADTHGLEKILMPRPGCGLGGLKWEGVKKSIGSILNDRFLVINND